MSWCHSKILVKFLTPFLLIIPALTSCEGEVGGHGYVYDRLSDMPVDSALVKYYTKKNKKHYEKQLYTDSKGYFNVGSFEGCVPDCPDAVIELSKNGYKTVQIINPAGDTILLER